MKRIMLVILLTTLPVLAQNWVPSPDGLQFVENVWPMTIPGEIGVAQFNAAICAGQLTHEKTAFSINLQTPWANWGTYSGTWVSGPNYSRVNLPDGTHVNTVAGFMLGSYRPPSGPHFHGPQDGVYAYFFDTADDMEPGSPRVLGCGSLDIAFTPNHK